MDVSKDNSTIDRELVRRFAKQVIDGPQARALLLTRDNRADGWVSLDDAVDSGRAFTVQHRGDLALFDGDDANSIETCTTFARRLTDHGFDPVAWASGRPGHAQLVVSTSDQAAFAEVAHQGRAVGLQHRSPQQTTRPVCSPHRLGLPVGLLHPEKPADALGALADPSPGAGSDCGPATGLRRGTLRLLVHGDSDDRSGSETTFRIAMGAFAADYSAEHAFNLLMQPQHKGGECLRRRMGDNSERARRWFFGRVWPRAVEYVGEHPPIRCRNEAIVRICQMREAADAWPWPTQVEIRGAITMYTSSVRRVLEGVYDLATKAGTVLPELSVRQLADQAGVSKVTAQKALVALRGLGFLAIDRSGRGRTASRYRLALPKELQPAGALT